MVVFIYDVVDAFVLEKLSELKVKVVATRSAGFDHIDVKVCELFFFPLFFVTKAVNRSSQTATRLGMLVARVPKYSPNSGLFVVPQFTQRLLIARCRRQKQLPSTPLASSWR